MESNINRNISGGPRNGAEAVPIDQIRQAAEWARLASGISALENVNKDDSEDEDEQEDGKKEKT